MGRACGERESCRIGPNQALAVPPERCDGPMKTPDYVNRRLHPSPTMPEYLTLRHLVKTITEIAGVLERSLWKFPLRVLDAGAGCSPYRALFPADRFRYVAADTEALAGLSVLADGHRLPFRDGTFDLVLSNQVLEHVSNPSTVVAELKRMVSWRGYLLLSCPFVWEIHNFPADYWRFTQQALELFVADMDLVYLQPSTTTAECLVQTFNLYLNRSIRNESLKAELFRVNNFLATRLFSRRDTLLPANYVVLARWPDTGRRNAGETREVRIHADTPLSGALLTNRRLSVSGWIGADLPADDVSAILDGARVFPLRFNLPRLDVWRAFPQYRNAHRSGFAGEHIMDNLHHGEHTLEISAVFGDQRTTGAPIRFRL
jgi:SAM-dependent methyltransferase